MGVHRMNQNAFARAVYTSHDTSHDAPAYVRPSDARSVHTLPRRSTQTLVRRPRSPLNWRASCKIIARSTRLRFWPRSRRSRCSRRLRHARRPRRRRGRAPVRRAPLPGPSSTAVASPGAELGSPAAHRPNIVVLVSDDQTAFDLGCYGNKAIHTPNLDRLAASGVRFEHAFVTSPQCSPSRASILTGQSPVAIGMSRLHAPLKPSVPSVLEPLKKAGYYVASYRKVHLGDDFQKRWDYAGGFDEAPATIFAKRPKDRPLFLWVGFEDPHRPYHPNAFTPPHDPAKVIVPPFLPDTKKVRRDLADYYDAIARMDHEVGELLDALEAAGLAKDTFVTFTATTGCPSPGEGQPLRPRDPRPAPRPMAWARDPRQRRQGPRVARRSPRDLARCRGRPDPVGDGRTKHPASDRRDG